MIQKTARLWWVALLVGWSFDFLFWGKFPGISFLVFSAIVIGAGFWLSSQEAKRPSARSLWLLAPIGVFAGGTIIRREPLTTFSNYVFVLIILALLAQTFLGGRWLNYSLSDFVLGFFHLAISALAKPVSVFWMSEQKSESAENSSHSSRWRRSLPIVRGLLMAAPILLVFAVLLAAADPIFSSFVERLADVFKVENLVEYLFRGFMILVLAYLLSGVYAHALLESGDQNLIGLEKPWLPRFLGFTESGIVLGSVDVLFGIFVIVQFAYFFGGESNIQLEGYTYAEYARRGFGELILVAFFSLLLFLGLCTVTKRQRSLQRKAFSLLGVGLMLLVSVILVSAFRRLLLYESAYGFTRLRSYAHLFMVWLGVLLGVVVVLEILGRQRAFALAVLFAGMGYVLTLNLYNVDDNIVRQNVGRVEMGWDLDTGYLNSLSVDATPALLDAYREAQITLADRAEIAAILACRKEQLMENHEERSWQSFHYGEAQALALLEGASVFDGAQVYQTDYGEWWVLVNGEDRPCGFDY